MHVRIRFDGSAPRRWHLALLKRIAAQVHWTVSADPRPGGGGMPRNGELLFTLERAIYGLPHDGLLSEPVGLAEVWAVTAGDHPPPDLIVDLCGDVPVDGPTVWRLTYDGLVGDQGLLAALLDARAPVATLRDQNGTIVAVARIGTESNGVVAASFEDGLARSVSLITAALDGGVSALLPEICGETLRGPASGDISLPQVARRSSKMMARMLVRRLYYLCYHAPHWRTGWRKLAGPDLFDLRHHPAQGWQVIPDDGLRFYADPFPIEHAGHVTLFVEEYIHRLGRGVISAVAFGPDGPLGRPEPVLDLDYHLSYPFVFAAEGELWMIPESCAAGRIDLFRATDFPRGWVHAETLVDGIVASDATLYRHDDRWWMFATVRDGGGAFSDALHLWSASDFRGPWIPHDRNPVLIDIASARPAGRIVTRNGALFRPVQDCRTGYGAALGIARILRLDDMGFEQVVETVLRAGPEWPGRRLHTLNAAGGFEFIDGSGHARRSLLR